MINHSCTSLWQKIGDASNVHEAQPSGFRPDKTRAAIFLSGFKNIPGKACVNRVHNNYPFVNVDN